MSVKLNVPATTPEAIARVINIVMLSVSALVVAGFAVTTGALFALWCFR